MVIASVNTVNVLFLVHPVASPLLPIAFSDQIVDRGVIQVGPLMAAVTQADDDVTSAIDDATEDLDDVGPPMTERDLASMTFASMKTCKICRHSSLGLNEIFLAIDVADGIPTGESQSTCDGMCCLYSADSHCVRHRRCADVARVFCRADRWTLAIARNGTGYIIHLFSGQCRKFRTSALRASRMFVM